MININGVNGYDINTACAIIGLYIYNFKGVKVRVAPDFKSSKEKELFEKASMYALAWYEEQNGM